MIRQLTDLDVDALFSVFSDSSVTQFMGIPLLKDLADATRLLADIDSGLQNNSLFQWGIEEVELHDVIGTCTLSDISWINQRAEIGFALAQSHWGRGLMVEALPLLVHYSFCSLGLNRLEADIDPRNQRSLKTLERLGFRQEGHRRQRHCVNGEFQDSIMLGLLAGDWQWR